MRHRYACQIRWADQDLLAHVNNVEYVDYLQEARADLMRALLAQTGARPDPADGLLVSRHEVTYQASLHYGPEPVQVEVWVTSVRAATFTLASEIFNEDEDGIRTVYVRASTVMAAVRLDEQRPRRLSELERASLSTYLEETEPRPRVASFRVEHRPEGHFPIHVRFSDLDPYRHVNNVVYFEYFQEARIAFLSGLAKGLEGFPMVVIAQADVDYVAQMETRAAPYDCWSQVQRVGSSSVTIASEITDGDRQLARARVTLVFVDPETGRATMPPEEYRERLQALAGSEATAGGAPSAS